MGLPGKKTNSSVNNADMAARICIEYGDFIRGVIRSQVKDEASVEDLFQDFFLSIIIKPIPENMKYVKSYIYRAIINDIIDNARKRKIYQEKIHKYAKFSYKKSINKNNPTNAIINIEETNKMFELIEKLLPHSQAEAITLRYHDDCKLKEVARKMDIDKKSASRYISVGVKKIRDFLQGS